MIKLVNGKLVILRHILNAAYSILGRFKFIQNLGLFRLIMLIVTPQGGFIYPARMRNSRQKKSHCHYSRFYMFSLSFRKIETKNLNSDPHILILVVLGITSLLHISYLNIRSDHEIEAVTFIGFSKNVCKIRRKS